MLRIAIEGFWQFAFKCLGHRNNLELMKQMKRKEEVIFQAGKGSFCHFLTLALRQSSCPRAENVMGFFSLFSL